jgi:hypothetical protein
MTRDIQGLLQAFEEWIILCESLYDLDEATWESSLEPGKCSPMIRSYNE